VNDGRMERRVTHTLTVGSKCCLMFAALFFVAAGFFLTAPVHVTTAKGSSFDCGSATNRPTDPLAKAICGNSNQIQADKAYALGAAGLVIAVGGLLTFGTHRKVETRFVGSGAGPADGHPSDERETPLGD
jgi:hypothetical protein